MRGFMPSLMVALVVVSVLNRAPSGSFFAVPMEFLVGTTHSYPVLDTAIGPRSPGRHHIDLDVENNWAEK
jgi:hypothetical protein